MVGEIKYAFVWDNLDNLILYLSNSNELFPHVYLAIGVGSSYFRVREHMFVFIASNTKFWLCVLRLNVTSRIWSTCENYPAFSSCSSYQTQAHWGGLSDSVLAVSHNHHCISISETEHWLPKTHGWGYSSSVPQLRQSSWW